MAPFTFYKIVEKKMESVYEMKKIAVMHSDFKEKFGIPRQSGLVEELESYIVFEPEYRNPDALRGLEGFSHIWILWLFSKNRRDHFSPTVRPPRLGGNKRMGVFATRSSFRPNSIAMSSVEICGIQYRTDRGPVIRGNRCGPFEWYAHSGYKTLYTGGGQLSGCQRRLCGSEQGIRTNCRSAGKMAESGGIGKVPAASWCIGAGSQTGL